MVREYVVVVDTPIGRQKGNVLFDNSRKVLNGYVEYKGKKYYFESGVMIDDKFEFTATIKSFLITVNFKAVGRVYNNQLNAKVMTRHGTFNASGVKK